MKKGNFLKIIGIIVVAMLVLFAGIPLFLEHIIFRNNVYSVLTNGEWGSFLGSYIGGIVGGAGTLIALCVTTNETRKIQAENLNQIKADRSIEDKKERKQFANGIAEDISVYVTDISNYFYTSRRAERLNTDKYNADIKLNVIHNQIQHQYRLQEKLNIEDKSEEYIQIDTMINKLKDQEAEAKSKLQHIENEIDKNQANRTIAIERYFVLKIKLQNIKEAMELIKKLEYIHQHSGDIHTEFDFIDKETRHLLSITAHFIDKYVNQRI